MKLIDDIDFCDMRPQILAEDVRAFAVFLISPEAPATLTNGKSRTVLPDRQIIPSPPPAKEHTTGQAKTGAIPMGAQPTEKLLTRKEAAKALKISLRKLDNLVRTGAIPSVKIGRRRQFDIAEVIAKLKGGGH